MSKILSEIMPTTNIPGERNRPAPAQWHRGLPDSDITVLIRMPDPEYPIVLGYHDGTTWRLDEGSRIYRPVLGWMDLNQAATKLDV